MRKFFLLAAVMLFTSAAALADTKTSAGNGSWASSGTWSPSGVPAAGDDVVIRSGDNVTVGANATVANISFGNSLVSTGTITVSSGITLTVSGDITVGNSLLASINATLAGAGTINCANLYIGGSGSVLGVANSSVVTSTISNLNISNNLAITGQGPVVAFSNKASLKLNSGIVTVDGAVTLSGGSVANSAAVIDMTSGAASATLNVDGTASISTAGTTTVSFNGGASTVNYGAAGAQTAFPTTYANLILSGSGAKTLTGISTINKNFVLDGSASGTAATDITVAGDLTINAGATFNGANYTHNIAGSWSNSGTFTASTSTINFNTNSNKTIGGSQNSGFYNLTINKGTNTNTITNSTAAFSVANNLTVTKGNLVLQATDVNYTVTNDVIVASNGTLTHSVNWTGSGRLMRVSGNVAIDGKFTNASVRSHFQMNGVNKTVRTGSTAGSAFCILTLTNSSGTITADGPLTINDNFWTGYDVAGGSFNTNGQTIAAKAILYVSGGTLNINGGSLTVTGGFLVGNNLAGTVNFTSGTLTTDALTIAPAGTTAPTCTFNQSGGTANINGVLTISTNGNYICTNSPAINVKGNWSSSGDFEAATSTVTLSGTTTQTINGGIYTSPTTFYNLTNSNAAGISTGLNTTVTNNLTLSSSKITTGGNVLMLTKATPLNAISGVNTTRYIVGNLEFAFPAGNTNNLLFPIGTSALYAPVALSLTGVAGDVNITASTATTSANENVPTANASGIDQARKAANYWTLSLDGAGTFASYDAKFDFSNIGRTGTVGNYKLRNFTTEWSDLALPTIASNTIAKTGLTNFGEFEAGEVNTLTVAPSANKSVCEGSDISFTASSTSTPATTIKWQRSVDGVAAYIDITENLDAGTIYGDFTTNTLTLTGSTAALNNYYYRPVATNINGAVFGTPSKLTVTTRPTAAISGSQVSCSGLPSGNLSVALTGTQPWSLTYTDGTAPVTVNSITTNPYTFTVSPTVASTYTITALSDSKCVAVASDLSGNADITLYPLPAIIADPATTQTVCVGTAVSFSVAASGDGLSYKWYKGATLINNSATVTGATSSTLTLNTPATTDAGTNYRCVVTNICGVTAISANAELIVKAAPTTANAGPDQTGSTTCGLTSVALAANTPAVGTGVWTIVSGTGGSLGASGSPTSTFSGIAGNTYTLRWTITNSPCAESFDEVDVTFNVKPTVTNSSTADVCSDGTTSINLTASLPSSFSWTIGTISGGITGATSGTGNTISQELANPGATAGSVQYRVTPVSTTGGCTGTMFTITVAVNPKPEIPNQTATICSGSTFTISPVHNNPVGTIVPVGTTYSWSNPVVTGGITGGSAQSGQTSISQTLTNPTNTVQTATYTVTPFGNCAATNFTVTVTVNPSPVVPAQTSAVCSGTGFSITPANAAPTTIIPTGTTYKWTAPVISPAGAITGGSAQSSNGITSIGQTLTNITISPATAIYTVTPTSGAAGSCAGANFTVTVTVNTRPVILPGSQSVSVCSGSSFSVTPANGIPSSTTIVPAGTTYAWSVPTVTGGITGGSAQTGQASISQTLVNPTNTNQTATYTVTPTVGGCAGAAFTITVTVNPTPVIPAQLRTTCSAVAFTTPLSNNAPTTIIPSSTNYKWALAPTISPANAITGGSAQATGVSSIGQTLTNITNADATATYTVVPTSGATGNCAGAPFTVTVTVNPKATIANYTTAICSGAAFTITPANAVPSATTIVPAGTTYTWTAANNNNVGGETNQTTAQPAISQVLTNTTTSNQVVVYTVTATSGSCGGTSTFTVNVTVYPSPTVTAVSNATYCATASGTAIAFASNLTGATYSWTSTVDVGFGTSGTGNIPAFTAANATATVVTAMVSVVATVNGCSGPATTFTITVNPTAIPEINANYCYGGGKVSLTATVTPSMSVSYLWNTAETTSTVYVDVASTYFVTATNTYGCKASISTQVADELVSNGNFSLGNTGFTSNYTYVSGAGSMYPEGLYTVGSDAHYYHGNFWGPDHTTGTGNFLIVNGNPAVGPIIWKQPTITVRANTDYYFAAWARSINDVSPFARLQFNINGAQVGTIDTLVAGVTNQTGPFVWKRFYGIWNSGANTTADISITDLETIRNGNDFGLDDISFGTLAAVPFSVVPTNNVAGAGCLGSSVTLSSGVVQGIAPFTYAWTGPNSFTSTQANPVLNNLTNANSGSYSVAVKDKYGCPVTGSTAITINPQSTITIAAVSGSTTQNICINTPLTSIKYNVTNGTGATVAGLPSGVTGLYSGGVYTISGTPTVNGTFNYTVTTTSTCSVTTTGTITVAPNAAIALTLGTANQTPCVGTNTFTTTVYTVSGAATGASITVGGLPTGMSGIYSTTNKTFTISGTPTVAGTFNYTVTTSGSGCVNPSLSGTITVRDNGNITRTSAAATTSQAICINSPITNITYAISGAGSGASVAANTLPAGVTGVYSGGVFTISGTPTVAGTFNYTVTVSGSSCTNYTATGSITVTANGTLALTSATATASQDICVSGTFTNVVYTVGGSSTGVSISPALPAGLSGTFNNTNKTYTISGSPTASGNFAFTVSATGSGCVNPSLPLTINVRPNATLVLSGGSTAQNFCIGTSLANITYTVGGAATGASIIAGTLPAGVTGAYSGGIFTISGTPTETGTFNYTVTTSGSTCVNPSLSGSITVKADATLDATGGAAVQTPCINTAITPIAFAMGGSATSISLLSGSFPAGVTGVYSTGVFTISGTPTVAGTFNYSVKTAGSACVNPTISGTITVQANGTISKTTGPATETLCVNTANITTVKYTIGGAATGVVLTGSLPAGVTGSLSGNVYTISGKPTVSGTFNYTVATTGSNCVNPSLSGTIIVNGSATITRTSPAATATQHLCIGTTMTPITYAVGGNGTGAVLTGSLPAGVTGVYSNGVFTISGTPTNSNTFNYTVATTGSSCTNPSIAGTITILPDAILSLVSVSGSNAQTVCVNTPIVDVVYNVGGSATAASIPAASLPDGVTGYFDGTDYIITGTPTESGVFPYTLTTTGTCSQTTTSGSITVLANATLSLITDISTTNQKVCINTGIQTISYAIGGTGTGVTVTGLPTGVTSSYENGVLTITGAPSVGGIFPYTISNTEGCVPTIKTGTITIPDGTPGLWTGAYDNDWFNCMNWANGVVPDNSVNVVIPDYSTVLPVIDTNSLYAPADKIARAKDVTVGSTLTFHDGAVLNTDGNVLIKDLGKIDMTAGGEIETPGNWTNNVGEAGFVAGVGKVTFDGATPQTISTVGVAESFYNLNIAQPAGPRAGVTLLDSVRVANTLTLENGIVNTQSATHPALGILTLGNGATQVAGNLGTEAFINGKVAKEENSSATEPYVLPVGKIGAPVEYRPAAVQPVGSNTNPADISTFIAEYMPATPPNKDNFLGVVTGVVNTEYWQIDRVVVGTPRDAKVILDYINPGAGNWSGGATGNPCTVCPVSVVKLFTTPNPDYDYWNFSKPNGFDRTYPEYRFYDDNGNIYSDVFTSFGAFTLGFGLNVLLPIQLVTFEGRLVNADASLGWKITDPKDLAGFELEHSTDGTHFTKLSTIAGSAATSYGFVHRNLAAGKHFYRLLVNDKDGTKTYSQIVLLTVGKQRTEIIGLYSTVVKGEVTPKIVSASNQQAKAIITDVLGRQVAQKEGQLQTGANQWRIQTGFLASGMYFITIMTDDKVKATLRFMKE